MSVASQKCRTFNVNFSQGNRWNQLQPGQDHFCHIVLCKEILDQNRQVCWSIVVRRNQLLFFHFSGRLLLTASLRRRRISLYLSLEIPVYYTSQFRKNFEANPYKQKRQNGGSMYFQNAGTTTTRGHDPEQRIFSPLWGPQISQEGTKVKILNVKEYLKEETPQQNWWHQHTVKRYLQTR